MYVYPLWEFNIIQTPNNSPHRLSILIQNDNSYSHFIKNLILYFYNYSSLARNSNTFVLVY